MSANPVSASHLPLDYANSILYEMERAFFDERGRGARFRMTTVGREYFKTKIRPLLDGCDMEQILMVVERVLQTEGILTHLSYSNEERLIRVKVEGCLHRPLEEKMAANGVEPFTCIPANLIVLALEDIFDKPVELADIRLEEGACQLLLIRFDKRPALD
jgi:hypothetical protein